MRASQHGALGLAVCWCWLCVAWVGVLAVCCVPFWHHNPRRASHKRTTRLFFWLTGNQERSRFFGSGGSGQNPPHAQIHSTVSRPFYSTDSRPFIRPFLGRFIRPFLDRLFDRFLTVLFDRFIRPFTYRAFIRPFPAQPGLHGPRPGPELDPADGTETPQQGPTSPTLLLCPPPQTPTPTVAPRHTHDTHTCRHTSSGPVVPTPQGCRFLAGGGGRGGERNWGTVCCCGIGGRSCFCCCCCGGGGSGGFSGGGGGGGRITMYVPCGE